MRGSEFRVDALGLKGSGFVVPMGVAAFSSTPGRHQQVFHVKPFLAVTRRNPHHAQKGCADQVRASASPERHGSGPWSCL